MTSSEFLQGLYNKAISQGHWMFSEWYKSYEEAVHQFRDAATNESWNEASISNLIKTKANGIANYGQGALLEKDRLKIVEDWNQIVPKLKELCLAEKKDIPEICDSIRSWLKSKSTRNYKVVFNRLFAAFLPNIVSTAADEGDFYGMINSLKSMVENFPELQNDWIRDNINFVDYCNQHIQFKEPWHSSIFAWYLKEYFDNKHKEQGKIMNNVEKIKWLLSLKKNIILQGAPGTGKTYSTAALALAILGITGVNFSNHKAVMDRYNQLLIKFDENGNVKNDYQIGFVTFHQSMDYEDFVEGIKPSLEKNDNDGKASQVVYDVEDGIFKTIAQQAAKDPSKKYVLIIDEINRGNVSKIFGELISLLEADKRAGADHPLSVILPFSKESFSVPQNLYIIGTMNTTDRSVSSIDYAVRRRFAFVTLEADKDLVPEGDAQELFDSVKNFLEINKYDMDIEDLMVGHSYFMDAENLQMKWQYEILPLLMEYHKDGIISKSPLKKADGSSIDANVKTEYKFFIAAWKKDEKKP